MNKNILAINDATKNGKMKFVFEDRNEEQFYFIDIKQEATVYKSVEIYEDEQRLKEFLQEHNYGVVEIKRIKI